MTLLYQFLAFAAGAAVAALVARRVYTAALAREQGRERLRPSTASRLSSLEKQEEERETERRLRRIVSDEISKSQHQERILRNRRAPGVS